MSILRGRRSDQGKARGRLTICAAILTLGVAVQGISWAQGGRPAPENHTPFSVNGPIEGRLCSELRAAIKKAPKAASLNSWAEALAIPGFVQPDWKPESIDQHRGLVVRAIAVHNRLDLTPKSYRPNAQEAVASSAELDRQISRGTIQLQSARIKIDGGQVLLFRVRLLGPGAGTVGSPSPYTGPLAVNNYMVLGGPASDPSVEGQPILPYGRSYMAITDGENTWFLDQALRQLRAWSSLPSEEFAGDRPVCNLSE
jgi:hypothetical protein